jgi:triacylglycerol lipase
MLLAAASTVALATGTTASPVQAAPSSKLPVVYSSLAAVIATTTKPDTPPPGANDWSCRSAAHPRPVILVHGTHANMRLNWNTLSPLLKNNGYCVFALNYGGLKFGQIGGTGDVVASAEELAVFVEKVRAATGADKVDFVGHSQGGMLPQYYVKFLGGGPTTNHIVGLAATSHGSTEFGISDLFVAMDKTWSGFAQLFDAVDGPAARQQLVGSEFVTKLTSVPDTVPGVKYTMIATKYDNTVTPYQSAFLDGPETTNIVVQDQCRTDLTDHLAMAYDHVALRDVLNALDPAHAQRPACFPIVTPFLGG